MFQLEMRLNYADEVLRMSSDEFKTNFGGIYNLDSARWDKVLSTYKTIAPEKKKVMAHYWNPTNYNNRDDLVIPVELADPILYPHHHDDMD